MAKKKEIVTDIGKVKKLLENIPEDRKPIADTLFKRLAFMEKTLDALQEQITADGATAMFKQGVQEFERESPALKAYNTTIQRYSLIYKQLIDLLPPPEKKQEADPLLDFIKDGKK